MSVVLLKSRNKPINQTLTNAAGNFAFNKLPYGKHKINVQKHGYTLKNISEVELNQGNNDIDQVVFQLTNNYFTLNIGNRELTTNNALKTYPNPINEVWKIDLNPRKTTTLTVQLYNCSG